MSILNQTFSDFELILIDDGSPDKSGKICDEMADRDQRIKVVHQENKGVSAARNVGLQVANGTYIMFCDSDDYVSPEWCEILHRMIKQDQVQMAVCGVDYVENGQNVRYLGVGECKKIAQTEFLDMVQNINLNELWNKIFVGDIIRNHILKFDEQISRCEDVLFILQYLLVLDGNACFCYGSPAVYHYNSSSSEYSGNGNH